MATVRGLTSTSCNDREIGGMESAHEGVVWALSWHPLGHMLASGSNDFTSKFWCRNRPGDEMDKYNSGVHALVISEEDVEDNFPVMMSTGIRKLSAITLPPPSTHKDSIPTAWSGGMAKKPQQQLSTGQEGLPQPSSVPLSNISVLGADIIAETFGDLAKKEIPVPTGPPTALFPPKEVVECPKEVGIAAPFNAPQSFRPHLLPPPNLPLPPHLPPPIPPANVPLTGMADNRNFPSPVSRPNTLHSPQLQQHQQQLPNPLEKPGWAQKSRGAEFIWPESRGPPLTPSQAPGNFSSNRQSPYTWQRSNYNQNRRSSYEEERQFHPDAPPHPRPQQQQRLDTLVPSQNPYVYRRPDAEPPSAHQQRDPRVIAGDQRITAGDPRRAAQVSVLPLIATREGGGGGPGPIQQTFPGKEGLDPSGSGPHGPPTSSEEMKEYHQGRLFPTQSAMGKQAQRTQEQFGFPSRGAPPTDKLASPHGGAPPDHGGALHPHRPPRDTQVPPLFRSLSTSHSDQRNPQHFGKHPNTENPGQLAHTRYGGPRVPPHAGPPDNLVSPQQEGAAHSGPPSQQGTQHAVATRGPLSDQRQPPMQGQSLDQQAHGGPPDKNVPPHHGGPPLQHTSRRGGGPLDQQGPPHHAAHPDQHEAHRHGGLPDQNTPMHQGRPQGQQVVPHGSSLPDQHEPPYPHGRPNLNAPTQHGMPPGQQHAPAQHRGGPPDQNELPQHGGPPSQHAPPHFRGPPDQNAPPHHRGTPGQVQPPHHGERPPDQNAPPHHRGTPGQQQPPHHGERPPDQNALPHHRGTPGQQQPPHHGERPPDQNAPPHHRGTLGQQQPPHHGERLPDQNAPPHHRGTPGQQQPPHHGERPADQNALPHHRGALGQQQPPHHGERLPDQNAPLHHRGTPGQQQPPHHGERPPDQNVPPHHMGTPGQQQPPHHREPLNEPPHHRGTPGQQQPPRQGERLPDKNEPPHHVVAPEHGPPHQHGLPDCRGPPHHRGLLDQHSPHHGGPLDKHGPPDRLPLHHGVPPPEQHGPHQEGPPNQFGPPHHDRHRDMQLPPRPGGPPDQHGPPVHHGGAPPNQRPLLPTHHGGLHDHHGGHYGEPLDQHGPPHSIPRGMDQETPRHWNPTEGRQFNPRPDHPSPPHDPRMSSRGKSGMGNVASQREEHHFPQYEERGHQDGSAYGDYHGDMQRGGRDGRPLLPIGQHPPGEHFFQPPPPPPHMPNTPTLPPQGNFYGSSSPQFPNGPPPQNRPPHPHSIANVNSEHSEFSTERPSPAQQFRGQKYPQQSGFRYHREDNFNSRGRGGGGDRMGRGKEVGGKERGRSDHRTGVEHDKSSSAHVTDDRRSHDPRDRSGGKKEGKDGKADRGGKKERSPAKKRGNTEDGPPLKRSRSEKKEKNDKEERSSSAKSSRTKSKKEEASQT